MTLRSWLWAGTVFAAALFVLGVVMAEGALEVVSENRDSYAAYVIAGFFIALPVFCIVGPFSAWRAHGRKRPAAHVVGMLLAPVVYAVFLLALFTFA